MTTQTVIQVRLLFVCGQILATPGALAAMEHGHIEAATLLERHGCGDWGDICSEDWSQNTQALEHGGRLFSVYAISDSARIWIITEADRSITTLLLPEEY